MKKTIGLILALALLIIPMANAQDKTGLLIYRTRIRDLTVYFHSTTGLSANCNVWQRLMFWQNYQPALNFTVESDSSYTINMTNLSPFYKDLMFDCTSGNVEIMVNSVYVMGALIEPSVCTCPAIPTCPTTTTTTTIPTTTTTLPTTTTTTIPCYAKNTPCLYDWQCCSNDCKSNHKCA